MKKLKYLFVLILAFAFVPTVVNAGDGICIDTNTSGNGGSYTTSHPGYGPGGGYWTCGNYDYWSWSYNGTVGMRLTIYQYKKGSNKTTMIGHSVDIWSEDVQASGRYSSHNTNNLQIRISRNNVNHINTSNTISGTTYNNQYSGATMKNGNIRGQVSDGQAYKFALVWTGTGENAKPISGVINTYLLQDLIKDNDQKVLNRWGMTKAQLEDIKLLSGNYYVTAEMMYKVTHYQGNSCSGGWGTSQSYYLPYSEIPSSSSKSGYYRRDEMANNLLVSKPTAAFAGTDVGDIVPARIDKQGRAESGTDLSMSNNGYGMSIYNIKQVCYACGGCDKVCSSTGGKEKGTPARMACATAYCSKKDPNNPDCVKNCAQIPKNEGCDESEKCDTYINNYSNTKVTKNGTEYKGGTQPETTCNPAPVGKEDTAALKTDDLSARICYDNNKDFKAAGEEVGQDIEYKVGGNVYSETKYYRVVCTENAKLKELPTEQKILLSTTSNSNITFSYLLTYTNTCRLEYKSADETNWLKGEENYSKSLLKKHHDSIGSIKLNGKTVVSTKKTTLGANEVKFSASQMKNFECAGKKTDPICVSIDAWKKYKNHEETEKDKAFQEAAVGYYLDIKYDLENTHSSAKNRIKTLINGLTTGGVDLNKIIHKNELSITVLDYNKDVCDESTRKVELLPIICMPDSSTKSTSTYVCLINGKNLPEGYQVRVEGQTNFKCENAVDTKIDTETGEGKYTYSVYYALPSSYVSAQADSEDEIFKNDKDCQDAVKSANGFCTEVQYSYTLPKYIESKNTACFKTINDYATKANARKTKINLDFEAGLCHELKDKYVCDYKVETEFCSACQDKLGTPAYEECYKKNCEFDCNQYCGTNQICRAKYCPELCEGCNWIEVKVDGKCNPGDPGCCTSCDTTTCDSLEGKGTLGNNNWTSCIYDECCTKACNGNENCTTKCCVDKCVTMYGGNATEKGKCISECYNGSGTYVYRNISLTDPFPDREDNVGGNWYNKVQYITNNSTNQGTGAEASKYADATNGDDDAYEYKIEITSDQLKKIKKEAEKKDNDYNTYYTKFKNKNTSKGAKAYESEFLNSVLQKDFGVTVSKDGRG